MRISTGNVESAAEYAAGSTEYAAVVSAEYATVVVGALASDRASTAELAISLSTVITGLAGIDSPVSTEQIVISAEHAAGGVGALARCRTSSAKLAVSLRALVAGFTYVDSRVTTKE